MKQLISISLFLLIFSQIHAQNKDFNYILNLVPDSISNIEFPKDSNYIFLKMGFATAKILNKMTYAPIRGQAIEEITLIYTSYHQKGFNQRELNRQRLEALQKLAPEVFQQFQVKWKIVAQTAADSRLSGERLFHGFLIRYRPSPDTESMDAEISYLENLFGKEIPDFGLLGNENDSILRKAERMPSFAGGETEKRRYFDRNLKYPEQALERRKEGTVLVSIIIDEDGNITEPKLLRGFDAECDQEALRLVKEMPKWNPGMEGDDFVKVKFTFPVNFHIKGGGKKSDYIYYSDYWKEQNIYKDSIGKVPLTSPKAGIENDVFINIFNRHPDWGNLSVACDLTGSMSPYTAQLLVWFKEDMQSESPKIRYFSFFNDGDKTVNTEKKIGQTRGIYQSDAVDFNVVKATVYKTMRNGSGGDLPENNVEAALAAATICPDCALLMIADNFATPRDISLATSLFRPLKIIVCGAEVAVNPAFLDIARATGGSVHTKSFDVENLSELEEGELLTIGQVSYQLVEGNFVLLR